MFTKIFYVGFLLTPAVLCRVLISDFFLQHFTLLSCAFIQFYYPFTRFCYTYESFIFLNLIIDVLLANCVCRQFLLFLVPVTIYSLRWWGGGGGGHDFKSSQSLLPVRWGGGGIIGLFKALWRVRQILSSKYSYRPPLLPTWEDK